MPRLTQYIEIDKEAKRRRRAHNYEYRFDWPEMAAVDAKLAPLMAEHLKRASTLISISSRLSDEQDEEKVYTDVMLIRDFSCAHLKRASTLISISSRLSDEQDEEKVYTDVMLIRDLLRATMAVRSTLCLVSIGHYGDAWATARVIAERAIYLAYMLKTGKAKEFMESRWLERKEWAYKVSSPSLGLLPRELATDYDAVSEEVWGRKLGRLAPHVNKASTWGDPGVEQMCREAFGQGASGIYSLYRDMSARLHPGMHDGGDEYLAEAVTATLGVVGQRYPWPLKAALDAFGALMDRVEPVLRGA